MLKITFNSTLKIKSMSSILLGVAGHSPKRMLDSEFVYRVELKVYSNSLSNKHVILVVKISNFRSDPTNLPGKAGDEGRRRCGALSDKDG